MGANDPKEKKSVSRQSRKPTFKENQASVRAARARKQANREAAALRRQCSPVLAESATQEPVTEEVETTDLEKLRNDKRRELLERAQELSIVLKTLSSDNARRNKLHYVQKEDLYHLTTICLPECLNLQGWIDRAEILRDIMNSH